MAAATEVVVAAATGIRHGCGVRALAILVAACALGAAGLTSSTVETADRGGVGVEIDVQKVSRRETGMTPYEIMLSESQERMLVIVEAGRD